MMIYTKIVFDFKTGKVLKREGGHYEGEIAWCGGGKKPNIPPPPPPPKTPKEPSAQGQEAREMQRQRAKRYVGPESNIRTGGLGLMEGARTERKTLLGQ